MIDEPREAECGDGHDGVVEGISRRDHAIVTHGLARSALIPHGLARIRKRPGESGAGGLSGALQFRYSSVIPPPFETGVVS